MNDLQWLVSGITNLINREAFASPHMYIKKMKKKTEIPLSLKNLFNVTPLRLESNVSIG